MLPGIDGFEVCRSIRRTSDVPIIMVTARADTHDVVAGLEAGRRRLPHQAVRPQGAVGPHPGPAAPGPHHRPGRRPPRASATSRSSPRRASCAAAASEVHLTKTEFRLLVELASSPGRVLQPRGPARAGVGLRLLRRRPPGRRPRPPPAHQGRGRPGQPPPRRHRAGPRLQAPDLTGAARRAAHGASTTPPVPARLGLRRARSRSRFAAGAPAAVGACWPAAPAASPARTSLDQREATRHPPGVPRTPASIQHADRRRPPTPRPSARRCSTSARHRRSARRSSRPRTSTAQVAGCPASRVRPATRIPDVAAGSRSRTAAGPDALRARRRARSSCVGIPLPRAGRGVLRGRLARRAGEHARVARPSRCSARRSSPPSPAPRSATGSAAGPCARSPTSAWPPRPSPAAGSTPGSRAATTPTSTSLVTSFNHMAQALEERIERDGRFASDVSHELRSPLMTLAASVEVLETRRDEMPDERPRTALDLLAADVDRFQQLVEDLLEISRFDAGVARLSLEEVQPRPSSCARRSASVHRPARARSRSTPTSASIVVRADKRRLVRVIANLLDNAEKYGGGATCVTVDRTRRLRRDRGRGRRRRGRRPRTASSSSTASPAAPVAPAAAPAPATASASGSPSSPSTSASTAAGVGRGPPRRRAGARFVVELPVGRGMSRAPHAARPRSLAVLLLALGVAGVRHPEATTSPASSPTSPAWSPTTPPATSDPGGCRTVAGVLHRHDGRGPVLDRAASGRPRGRAPARGGPPAPAAGPTPAEETSRASSAASRAAPSSARTPRPSRTACSTLDLSAEIADIAGPERGAAPSPRSSSRPPSSPNGGAEGPLPHRRRAATTCPTLDAGDRPVVSRRDYERRSTQPS